jgi:heme-degrading monooxygenase HmoA
MQQLRIVMYPSEGAATEAIKHWGDTIGAFLDDLDGLKTAIVADNGNDMVVVTRWESAEAVEAGLGSDGFAAAVAELQKRTGMSDEDVEPSMLYMGPIVTHTRGG